MNKTYRNCFLGLMAAIIMVCLVYFFAIADCGLGGYSGLKCPATKIYSTYYVWFVIIFVAIYCFLWNRNVSVNLPKILLGVFIVISLVFSLVPYLYGAIGPIYLRIAGTSQECEMWSRYSPGGESYAICYTNLAKKTGDQSYCEKSTKTREFGCYN